MHNWAKAISRWAATIAFLAAAWPTQAKVRPISSVELLGADLIFVGTIADVGKETITVEVNECIVGACDERIQVAKFKDWTCAARWTKYRDGQKILFFVAAPTDPSGKGPLRILGGADEGEIPIVDDNAYPPFLTDKPFGEFGDKKFDVYGGKRAFKTQVAPLINAIRDVRRGFDFRHNSFGYPTGIRRNVGDDELDSISQRSELHRAFVEEIQRFAVRLEELWRAEFGFAKILIEKKSFKDAEITVNNALERAEGFGNGDPRLLLTLELRLELLRKMNRNKEADELEARIRRMK